MNLSNPLNSHERLWGAVYLLLEIFVLPYAVALLNLCLQLPNWAVNFLCFCLNFGAVLIIFHKFLLGNLKTALADPVRTLGWAAAGMALYYALSFAVGIVITVVGPDYVNLNDDNIQTMSSANFAAMAIGTVLLVPVAEECLFRGVLFRGLFDRSPLLAYGVSAVLFSLVHIISYIGFYSPIMFLLAFIQYLPAGISLAFAYHRSDTIAAPVLMHTVINLIGISAMR